MRKRALLALGTVLVLIQFVRPKLTNPPVKPGNTLAAQMEVPPKVMKILEQSCLDCHSNRTQYPWYSQIAPASWLLAQHVNGGRLKMNIDDWAEDVSPKDICQETRVGSMPMKSYLLLHPNAKLRPGDVNTLCAWSQNVLAPKD